MFLAEISISGEVGLGDLIVGVGTLALAAATVWMARGVATQSNATDRMAGSTRNGNLIVARSVQVSEDALERSSRPWVVLDESGYGSQPSFDTSHGGLELRFRNIGQGSADVVDYRICVHGIDYIKPPGSNKVVFPNHSDGLDLSFDRVRLGPVLEALTGDETGYFVIYYRGVTGTNYLTRYPVYVLAGTQDDVRVHYGAGENLLAQGEYVPR